MYNIKGCHLVCWLEKASPCTYMFQLSQLQLAVSHGAAKQIRQLAGEEGLDLGLPLRGQVSCRHVGGV